MGSPTTKNGQMVMNLCVSVFSFVRFSIDFNTELITAKHSAINRDNLQVALHFKCKTSIRCYSVILLLVSIHYFIIVIKYIIIRKNAGESNTINYT